MGMSVTCTAYLSDEELAHVKKRMAKAGWTSIEYALGIMVMLRVVDEMQAEKDKEQGRGPLHLTPYWEDAV